MLDNLAVFWKANYEFIIPFMITIFIIGGIVWFSIWEDITTNNNYKADLNTIQSMGMNREDAHAFLLYTGIDAEDLIRSQAIQKHFKEFQNGKMTDFIKQAKAKKDADEAQDAANTATTMATIAIVNSMNHQVSK